MRITTLLHTLSLTTSALAAPRPSSSSLISRDADYVPANRSKCKSYNNIDFNWNQSVYEIYIGRPYLGRSKCPAIKAKIQAASFQVQAMKCSGTEKNGNTKITILSNMKKGHLKKVNIALKAAYPEIGFSCPTTMKIGD